MSLVIRKLHCPPQVDHFAKQSKFDFPSPDTLADDLRQLQAKFPQYSEEVGSNYITLVGSTPVSR